MSIENKEKLKNILNYEIGQSPVPNYRLAEKIARYGTEIVEPLTKILGKSESIASINAAITLGLIGDKRAVQPLLDALKRYSRKGHYIDALLRLKAYEAKDEIKKYLDSPTTNWMAARALFEFGEKELALKYILEGIKPFNTFLNRPQGLESRTATAYYCAEHKIEEAIDLLFDHIVDLRNYGIESLAIINGKDVFEKAKQMSSLYDVRGLYATYLLGLFKDEFLIDKFIDMLENFDKYVEKYNSDEKTMAGRDFVIEILGNYSNDKAIINFYKNLGEGRFAEDRISHFLFEYYEYHQCLRIYGISSRYKLRKDIVDNHGWHKYFKNELYSKAFASEFIPDKWDIEENGSLKYKEKIKNEALENIMKDIASKLKKYQRKTK